MAAIASACYRLDESPRLGPGVPSEVADGLCAVIQVVAGECDAMSEQRVAHLSGSAKQRRNRALHYFRQPFGGRPREAGLVGMSPSLTVRYKERKCNDNVSSDLPDKYGLSERLRHLEERRESICAQILAQSVDLAKVQVLESCLRGLSAQIKLQGESRAKAALLGGLQMKVLAQESSLQALPEQVRLQSESIAQVSITNDLQVKVKALESSMPSLSGKVEMQSESAAQVEFTSDLQARMQVKVQALESSMKAFSDQVALQSESAAQDETTSDLQSIVQAQESSLRMLSRQVELCESFEQVGLMSGLKVRSSRWSLACGSCRNKVCCSAHRSVVRLRCAARLQ